MKGLDSEIVVGDPHKADTLADRLAKLADEVEHLGLLDASVEIRRSSLLLRMEARRNWKKSRSSATLRLVAKS